MPRAPETFRPEEFEPRVQARWRAVEVFRARDEAAAPRETRRYVLDMFPYPSGEGLHVGHVEGYTASDIVARYLRMRGFDVLHPMGWDAFGLPAENTAIQQGIHPRALVARNVARFRQQLQRLGLAYDWSREIDTTDPKYYRWTQWIFLKLFHLGLAYEAVVPINWCPSCATGLANEEVRDGRCERCGTTVTKKDLRQWMLRITMYAERLLRDLEELDWPEGVKELQRNWIGRSVGTAVAFRIPNSEFSIRVFTTRADTLWGATYLVLAPEHALVERITTPSRRAEVLHYIHAARGRSERERTVLEKEKTGVYTGATAINPVNGEEIPIWVADYVLVSYGTGAIMAVPAHDARDFAFARKYGLPVREVIRPAGGDLAKRAAPRASGSDSGPAREGAFVEDGILVASGEFSGLPSAEARDKITAWLAAQGKGKPSVEYKLRDWVFSRQRYWGEPIPIVHCAACGVVPVPEEQLPVLLPEVERYKPSGTGESPLAAIREWVETTCPTCGKRASRETNTMPQWAGSCWYFLRFADPQNAKEPFSWEAAERWLPVDLYVGGAEHAVLHLLYARFFVKALFDAGYLPLDEPFRVLRNQGTILGPDGQKMSKSRGNVVTPDEIVARYGADTLRLYEMFLGPLDASKPWDPKAVPGVYRFLRRVWRLGQEIGSPKSEVGRRNSDIQAPAAVTRALHQLTKKVSEDIAALKFNTAIAAMMEFVNYAARGGLGRADFRTFLSLLSPFAPHLAEALWEAHGGEGFVAEQPWPAYDQALVVEEQITVIVQVNGKTRGVLVVPRGTGDTALRAAAEADAKVRKWLAGRTVARVVVVPDRLVNFVLASDRPR